MDFSLSKEQQDIKMAAKEFAEKEFPQVAQECDEHEKMEKQFISNVILGKAN